MTRGKVTVLAGVVAWVVGTGCGGGGGGGETPPATTEEAAAPGATASSGSGAGFGTATIRGRVTLDGAAPAAQALKMDADPYCSLQHPGGAQTSDFVVAADGGLQWVFVHVAAGLTSTYEPPSEPVVIDQKGCVYEPHVLGIMAGQTLKILNSDETLHNIHSLPKNSRQFNLAMPRAGMELTQQFTNPEVGVRIKCDVHPWMESWAGVVNHPFHSVSGADGSFSLDRLPAGSYTIEAWHEAAGTQSQTVVVEDGATQEITFSFKAPA